MSVRVTAHNKVFLILISSFVFMVFVISFIKEPFVGDLTRTGGFSENEFGWNNPIEVFNPNLFAIANSIKGYNRYYDIVVIGDSFTFNDDWVWLNFLVEKTGLSAIAFDVRKTSIELIVNADQFLETPPKMLIYESVERSAIERLLSLNISSENYNKSYATEKTKLSQPISLNPMKANKFHKSRNKIFRNFRQRYSETFYYIVKAILRIIKMDKSGVVSVKLKNKRDYPLFSCKNKKEILIYEEDINKINYSDKKIIIASKKAKAFEDAIKSNGTTKFIMLIFPDKFSVYSEFIYVNNISRSSIMKLWEYYNYIRLDTVLIDAIKRGVVDVYLPNDTHTGPEGSKLVAQSIIDHLMNEKYMTYNRNDHK